MGQNIAVGNPFGSEINLTDLSAALQTKFFKSIWTYELAAALTGAAAYEINLAAARPTLDLTNKRYICVVEAINTGQNISKFSIFKNAVPTNIFADYDGSTTNIASASLTGFSIFQNNIWAYFNNIGTSIVFRSFIYNEADKIHISLVGTDNVNTLKLNLYEADII